MFGISQNFQSTPVVGRFARTVPYKPEEYDENDEKKVVPAPKRVSTKHISAHLTRYATKSADHH